MAEYTIHRDIGKRPALNIKTIEEVDRRISELGLSEDAAAASTSRRTSVGLPERKAVNYELKKGYEKFKAESLAALKVHLLHNPEWAQCDEVSIKFHEYLSGGASYYLTYDVTSSIRVYLNTSDEDFYVKYKDEIFDIAKVISSPKTSFTTGHLWWSIWGVISVMAGAVIWNMLHKTPNYPLLAATAVLMFLNVPIHWLSSQ